MRHLWHDTINPDLDKGSEDYAAVREVEIPLLPPVDLWLRTHRDPTEQGGIHLIYAYDYRQITGDAILDSFLASGTPAIDPLTAGEVTITLVQNPDHPDFGPGPALPNLDGTKVRLFLDPAGTTYDGQWGYVVQLDGVLTYNVQQRLATRSGLNEALEGWTTDRIFLGREGAGWTHADPPFAIVSTSEAGVREVVAGSYERLIRLQVDGFLEALGDPPASFSAAVGLGDRLRSVVWDEERTWAGLCSDTRPEPTEEPIVVDGGRGMLLVSSVAGLCVFPAAWPDREYRRP